MIIAGNFKTNHTRSSTFSYCKELDSLLKNQKSEVYVFPSMCALPYDDFAHFSIGAQNAYPVFNGAYSGEIGLEQIQGLGINTLMVGHSERRSILGENDEICKRKFDFFSQYGMNVFFCIGEDLQARKSARVLDVLATQLKTIDLDYSRLVVAYEPIWAIGTGVSASLEEIEETHRLLKEFGCKKVIYGGSVNEGNAKDIMSLKHVDGVLVGGASLDLKRFYQIIQQGEKI